jgi:hypothetical protein
VTDKELRDWAQQIQEMPRKNYYRATLKAESVNSGVILTLAAVYYVTGEHEARNKLREFAAETLNLDHWNIIVTQAGRLKR